MDENKAFLPLEMFKEGGRGLLQDAYMNKIFRDQDKDHGIAVSRNPAGFQVIVTTKFAPEGTLVYVCMYDCMYVCMCVNNTARGI